MTAAAEDTSVLPCLVLIHRRVSSSGKLVGEPSGSEGITRSKQTLKLRPFTLSTTSVRRAGTQPLGKKINVEFRGQDVDSWGTIFA